MKHIKYYFLGLLLMLNLSVVFAADDAYHAVSQAGENWANAIRNRDPNKIVALYDRHAFLYATFSNMIDTHAGLVNYFTKLVKHDNLNVKFNRQNIRLYGNNIAINSGLYAFSYTEKGQIVTVPGRYTFVYDKTPNGWMIVDHHSSVMPEK